MPFHVPFEHRNQSARKLGPIYIGFDQPVSIQKRRKRFNWFAFSGLLTALISPLTLFIIGPLSLVLSLIGLRRGPRGMALVALVLSLISTSLLSLGIFAISHKRHSAHVQHRQRQVVAENKEQTEKTQMILETAEDEFRVFRSEHDHQLPSLEAGMMMTVRHNDGWGNPLRYGIDEEGCSILSAGIDGEFDTQDDLKVSLSGQPQVNKPALDPDLIGE